MFLGTYAPKLDDKGRLILPAKFRDELSHGVVLTRGQERCLYVFPEKEFERHVELIREAPLTSKAGRDFLRLFLSGASSEIPDKQFRVTIPPALREYAGLSRDLIVIGAGPGQKFGTPARGSPTTPRRNSPSLKPRRR